MPSLQVPPYARLFDKRLRAMQLCDTGQIYSWQSDSSFNMSSGTESGSEENDAAQFGENNSPNRSSSKLEDLSNATGIPCSEKPPTYGEKDSKGFSDARGASFHTKGITLAFSTRPPVNLSWMETDEISLELVLDAMEVLTPVGKDQCYDIFFELSKVAAAHWCIYNWKLLQALIPMERLVGRQCRHGILKGPSIFSIAHSERKKFPGRGESHSTEEKDVVRHLRNYVFEFDAPLAAALTNERFKGNLGYLLWRAFRLTRKAYMMNIYHIFSLEPPISNFPKDIPTALKFLMSKVEFELTYRDYVTAEITNFNRKISKCITIQKRLDSIPSETSEVKNLALRAQIEARHALKQLQIRLGDSNRRIESERVIILRLVLWLEIMVGMPEPAVWSSDGFGSELVKQFFL